MTRALFILPLGFIATLCTAEDPVLPGKENGNFNFTSRPIITCAEPDRVDLLIFTSHEATIEAEFSADGSILQTTAPASTGLIDAFTTSHTVSLFFPEGTRHIAYRIYARQCLTSKWPFKLSPRIQTGMYSFTMPTSSSNVSFTAFNDLHENHEVFRKLIEQFDKQPSDLIVLNGDMVTIVEQEQNIRDFIYTGLGERTADRVIHYLRGNHECRGPHARAMNRYLSTPSPDVNYYTFRQGPVQFMMLDTGEDKPDFWADYKGLAAFEAYREKQFEWIKQVVQTKEWTDAPFRVVFCHIPVWRHLSESWISECSQPFQTRWMKVLHNAGIDLMISGHTHVYEYRQTGYPLIVGGGPEPGTATRIYGEADDQQLRIQITDDTGAVLDRLTFNARDSR